MKMIKLASILLASSLALCMTACGSEKDEGTASPAPDVGSAAPESKTPENEGDAAPESDLPAPSDAIGGEEDKIEVQLIGSDEFGYMNIPDTWVSFIDLDGVGSDLQYSNPAGTSIITLSVFSEDGLTEDEKELVDARYAAESVWYNLEQSDVENITGATVTLAGLEAFQVYGSFVSEDHELDSIIICWIFEDANGVMHYVSAEAAEEDIFELLYFVEATYSLTKPE